MTLFSQSRNNPPPLDAAFGTFLPTLFIAFAFWRLAYRFVLPAFSGAPIERTVLYLATFWVGVLWNITTGWIPVDRLLSSDISQEKGALASVIIIASIVFVIAVNQIRIARKTGWLAYYIGWYVVGGLVAIVLSQLPGLQLRLHHYVAAMVLVPMTAFPTRPSALYQGLLLGMFLNGVAAFDLASILQTAADVRPFSLSTRHL